jgi:hypothetical protein
MPIRPLPSAGKLSPRWRQDSDVFKKKKGHWLVLWTTSSTSKVCWLGMGHLTWWLRLRKSQSQQAGPRLQSDQRIESGMAESGLPHRSRSSCRTETLASRARLHRPCCCCTHFLRIRAWGQHLREQGHSTGREPGSPGSGSRGQTPMRRGP